MAEWDLSQADWGAGPGVDPWAPPVRAPIDRTSDFIRSFAYTQGGAGGSGELKRFLDGLVAKGFTGDDFINGLEKYNQLQGFGYNRPNDADYPGDSFYKYNGNEHVGWWGEQKRIEAIGKGLDALGKPTGWQSQYNDALAQRQQGDVGRIGTESQNSDRNDSDLGDVLKFAGAAAGLYGLGGFLGAAGSAGALGEGALASTLAAEGSSGLLGAGSAGAAAGGGTSLGALGSGTFGLDLAGLGGTATGAGASTSLGSLGIGSAGSGLTATGGGALGSGLAGLGAADLGAVGLGGLAGGVAGGLGAAASGVGSPGIGADIVASGSGGGSSGGSMDWLDELINNTQGDSVWNTSGAGDVLSGLGSGNSGVSLPNGLDFDVPPSGVNTTTAPSGTLQNQLMQRAVDAGIPFDIASKLPTPGLQNLLNMMKGAGGTGAAAGSGGSVLSRLFGGSGGSNDLVSLLGLLGGGALDAYGANKQTDALKAISDRTWNAGAPSRGRYEAAMSPGFDIKSIPGLSSAMDTATETYLRKLSAEGGNPAGIGAAPSQTQAFVLGNVGLPAYQNYVANNSSAGGLPTMAGQYGQTATNAANSNDALFTGLGNTVNKLTQPQNQTIRLNQLGYLA